MTDSNAAEIARLSQRVEDLSSQVHDLVEAWNTAQGVVKFVKFLGALATAVTAVWALVKLGEGK